MIKCPICEVIFTRSDNLRRHLRGCHASACLCDKCGEIFPDGDAFNQHMAAPPPAKKIRLAAKTVKTPRDNAASSSIIVGGGSRGELVGSALNQRVATYQIKANPEEIDAASFLLRIKESVLDLIQSYMHEHRTNIKVRAELFANYIKPAANDPNGAALVELKSFNTKYKVVSPGNDLGAIYKEFCGIVLAKCDEFQERDSGWSLETLSHLKVHICKFRPIRGSSHIQLPGDISRKQACINVKNKDEACFFWAVTAALHPVKDDKNSARTSSYPHYSEVLKLDGLEVPMKIKDVPKFEKLNNVSINVYGLEYNSVTKRNDVVGPIYFAETRRENHINLLYTERDSKSHYVWIKNLSRLISSQISTHDHAKFLCDGCLIFFNSQSALLKHQEHDCNKIRSVMPTTDLIKTKNGDMVPGNILNFINYEKKMRVPFVVYADFESLLQPIESCSPDPQRSFTNRTHKHVPYSFAYYIKCSYDDSLSKFETFTGLNCTKVFMERLTCDVKRLYENHLNPIIPMLPLTSEEHLAFNAAQTCHICEKGLTAENKVADHCHLTGKFRGAAHSECNLNYKIPKFIPVFFHNLSGYDAHLFVKELACDEEAIDVIPQNSEKYISFSKSIPVDSYTNKVGLEKNVFIKLRFLDSLRFMASSLEKLASNLSVHQFREVSKFFNDPDQFNLVIKKGVFPYNYMDSYERLSESELPPKKNFYDNLTNTDLKIKDYKHAQNVWSKFNCKTLADYSDLYLKTDVLLLADVFENFRDVCYRTYSLDPAQYFTAPGLSWDAMLKMTGVELELFTDMSMHHFVQRGIRGGICQASLRNAKANNKFTPDYKPNNPDTYLTYWDANNLYGWAMSQLMPLCGFKWLSAEEIQNFSVNDVPDDSPIGYFLEVDVEYPQTLHDLHNDLPFLAENIVPPKSKFNQPKLIPNLKHKSKYVIHYRNLKQALANGLILKQIHRVISFEQSDWLKKYIDLNTSLRQAARNDFEKDFYKLMNNSVFGKTMENVDKRVDVKLVSHWDDIGKRRGAESLIARLNLKNVTIFAENLIAIEFERLKVVYNKPIYVGFSVLDLSKLLMYEFLYDFIIPAFGDKARLCYMDTDSFIFRFETSNIYSFIEQNLTKFDTSNFAHDNDFGLPLANKAVLGLMKDELGGKILLEFIGLRPKLYACHVNRSDADSDWLKKAKGIKKCVVKNEISGEDFRAALNQNLVYRQQNLFRSLKHEIFTMSQNKLALSPFDDKRYICPDGINTLAWGHYLINKCVDL